MAFSISNFRIDFPQFEDPAFFSDALVQRASERASLRIDEATWGSLYNEGLSYLTAYLLSESQISKISGGNSIGGVKSVSITNEASYTFSEQASGGNSERQMASNRYGAAYLDLEKQVILPLRII